MPLSSVEQIQKQFAGLGHGAHINKKTALDLFSGCGGLHIGVASRYHTVAFCDNNESVQQALAQRQRDGLLPMCPIFKDVRSLTPALLDPIKVQAIVAGFPCVDVSNAARSARANFTKTLHAPSSPTIDGHGIPAQCCFDVVCVCV